MCSQDKDGYTPPLTVKKQHDPIFKQVLLKVLRNERDEESGRGPAQYSWMHLK